MSSQILAYYRAATTKKKYIVIEKGSDSFEPLHIRATDIFPPISDSEIIDCSCYGENLGVLSMLFDDLIMSWGQNCYYYEWAQFLKNRGLSEYKFNRIKRLLKD